MNAVVAQPAAVPRQFAARSALRRNAGKAASAAPARARRSVAVRAAGNNEDKTVAIASIAAFLAAAPLAAVADDFAPPAQEAPASALAQFQAQTQSALGGDSLTAPDTKVADPNALPEGNTWRYSEFIRAVMGGKVERVRFAKDGASLQLTAVDGRRAQVTLPNDPELVDILAKNGVDISVSEGDQQGNYASLFGNLLFPLLAFGGLFFLFRRAQGGEGGGGFGGMGGGGPMDFGKSKSKFQEIPETGVTFVDVAGVDGAKLELQEVVDFLKNPDKYTQLGAKIPKGCLLVGPPGTGKTLLAKAVAGEAGVPFFSCAASEFVELFVGVGASRVRDLFEKAKSKAPCIVFIDEIDAVGRQRGSGMGGGNDEREQTINQLLTEMDGFEGNTGVIVLAATNRPDVLDSALLRPGRFDRQVTVDLPDVAGRIRILKVHARGKTIGKDVDFDKVARRTPGFSGAALQNLLNEAAILAARRDLTEISKEEIADALERIVAGAAKEGAVMSEKKKRLVAYHEAGHAIVGALMPEYDPVTKISIVPRGAAGGLTFFAPSEERLESGLYSRTYLENQMAVAMGGRVAEELIFGESEVTTGASSDLRQATRLAREMITKYGFSERLGLASTEYSDYGLSHETRLVIEDEVKRLLEEANQRARRLLKKHEKDLHMLAKQLLDKETLTGAELRRLVKVPAKSGDASFIEEGFGSSAVSKEANGGEKAETSGAGSDGPSPAEAAKAAAAAAKAAAAAAKAAAGRAAAGAGAA
mmetsp:Transcript_10807/g.46789  ORF Transcript_10807/g.46789 Transcript_10807/m.46789 type:complete len:759 (-) Transcript_10807:3294-5570(-)